MSSRASWSELLLALGVAACGGGGDADGGDAATGAAASDGAGTDAPGTTDGTDDGVADSEDDGPSTPPDCVAPEVTCGQVCADLDADPSNCGQCGISCVVDNAAAACVAGACALGTCDVGFADCDADPATGCEHVVDCDAGSSCATTCGSTGVVGCGDPCAPTCAAPAEVCNALDDDCDGACDQALAGCRIPVHRAIGGAIGHFYTTNLDEIGANGLTMEVQDFFFVYPEPVDGLIPLFRCVKGGGRRFLTSSIDCEGTAAPELTLGFIAPDDRCGATPLYRVYAPGSDDHFYTTSLAERDNEIAMFGYQDQGSPGSVF